ncbi:hypothetical protein [Streptomyces sp. NPDC007088]|uniref:hypothetical protein n=1 Tax=Streptomyces sp. NPDC007088 TaxID=3364773 RepID=UPI0036AA1DFB
MRAWLRARRGERSEDRPVPASAAEFAAAQRAKLLRGFGVEVDDVPVQRLDVALTGTATETHTVRIGVLGPFLENLQESVQAVAQALTGRPTSFASVPRWIKEETALSAAAVFPSSFGLTLYGPGEREAAPEQQTLFPRAEVTLDDALGVLLDLAELSESPRALDDDLAEELVGLGRRALKHLGSLTGALSDEGLGLRLSWRPREGQTRLTEWSPGAMQRVRLICEQSEFAEAEQMTVTGRLAAADMLRGSVEIVTEAAERVRAGVDEEWSQRLPEFLGRRVEAQTEVTRVLSAGRERRVYTVLSLREAEQGV